MIIRYDGRSKAAYIRLLDTDVIESEEVAPSVVYDFDIEDRVRGIEFYQLDSLSQEDLFNLELPMHPQEKEILYQCFFSDMTKKSSFFTVRVEKNRKGNFVSRTLEGENETSLPSRVEIT